VVPVDIEAIVEDLADVEYDVFPSGVDCDAVVIRKGRGRPHVVINEEKHENRRRFTLAHELGHIVLPWQVGTFFCHSMISYRAGDELIRAIEMDAHQFASELLVPGDWLRRKLPLKDVKPGMLSKALVDVASTAQVSLIVAALSAARFLPAETMLVLTEGGAVTYAITAPRSTCNEPDRGSQFAVEDYKSLGAMVGSVPYGKPGYAKVLHAVHFEPTSPAAERSATETSRDILSSILDALGIRGAERLHIQQSVAGVVGYANNLAAGDEHPLSKLRQRFGGRTELREVTAHPRFGEFLSAKAEELRDPKRKPRKRS
jgi:hypothetical protein